MLYNWMVANLLLFFCTLLAGLSASAATWQQDMDRNLNNKTVEVEGEKYTVKGWFYSPPTRKFIVYVENGNKWLLGYAKNPLFPQPAASVVFAADVILMGQAPDPQVYVFKEGSRELFKLDPDKILETLNDMKMR